MKNSLKFIAVALLAIFFTGCSVKEPEPYDYTAFLQKKPHSILVLMPTNDSTDVAGSAAVLANAVAPLSEAGYYVFPVALVNDTFKQNGITEPSEIAAVPLNKLDKIFQADSVLYINIKEYGTSYAVISSSTRVVLEAKLVDIKNGATLWNGTATAIEDSSSGQSSLLGMLVSAVISQVANTISDKSYDLAAMADAYLFSSNCHNCILYGPYSPHYGKDAQLHKDR
ncbi:lipoprotein, putative [Campylobacter concisus UNSWCS]|jgi:periplasmic protein|uniref:Lipoprotein, putative n=1 Tax=Campylobacter concisus UNSWCS TaxID=1242968 RepID=U2F1V7_9BACT|nr:DUF799 domain-containing protein [Campylobacter concisus]ERJ30471.1 lipoprotein, putative [Campylobacter concisus UNSWCS]